MIEGLLSLAQSIYGLPIWKAVVLTLCIPAVCGLILAYIKQGRGARGLFAILFTTLYMQPAERRINLIPFGVKRLIKYRGETKRNGYDFDTLIDEEKASHRAKKLMQPFLTGGLPNGTELHSFLLKAQAGFSKGGEKNFEGVLTEVADADLSLHRRLPSAAEQGRSTLRLAHRGHHPAGDEAGL